MIRRWAIVLTACAPAFAAVAATQPGDPFGARIEPFGAGVYGLRVALDADGDAVIVAEQSVTPPAPRGILAQRYNSAGDVTGLRLVVAPETSCHLSAPDVAMDARGNFVVSAIQLCGVDAYEVVARLFTAAGAPSSGTIRAAAMAPGDAAHFDAVAVAMDEDGDFALTWRRVVGADPTARVVWARHFDARGDAQGAAFPVAGTPAADGIPAVARNAAGETAIAWFEQPVPDSLALLQLQRFDASGRARPLASPTLPAGPSRTLPAVDLDDTGALVGAWTAGGAQDAQVLAQRFKHGTQTQGQPVLFGQGPVFPGSATPVSMDADGDFAMAWVEGRVCFSASQSPYRVRARYYTVGHKLWPAKTLYEGTCGSPRVDFAMDHRGAGLLAFGHSAQRLFGPTPRTGESVDLALTSSGVFAGPAGSVIAFDLLAANRHAAAEFVGHGTASGVAIRFAVPTGTSLVATDGAGWSCQATGATVDCVLAQTVDAGQNAPPLTVRLRLPASPGSATFTAAVTGDQPGAFAENDTVSRSITASP